MELVSAATVTVNGEDYEIAAGTYYLRDATPALSLIAQLELAIQNEVAGASVFIGKDRLLKIGGDGNVLTLAIPSALQGPLGLVGSPTPSAAISATSYSTLLWSAGWPERTNGHPVGTDGREQYDRVVTSSASGQTVRTVWHTKQTIASFSWSAVPAARAWTTAELPGEFKVFFDTVLADGFRWKLYSQVSEDAVVPTTVTWPTALGPYKAHVLPSDWYRRFDERSDSIGANIDLEAIKTGEIS
jgi:hypothetical protein